MAMTCHLMPSCIERLAGGGSLEIYQIQPGVATCEVCHEWHGGSRIWKRDVLTQVEQAQQRLFLLRCIQGPEGPGEMATSPEHRSPARSVVPVGRRE